jgi:folate-binding protein YgfZ
MIIQGMNAATTAVLSGAAALPHLGVILAEGEEAAKFLHGQLTQDFALLRPGEARLAGFCTAKGRMLASFVAARLPSGGIALVCSRDLLAPTLKRLSMFVLRAKVKLRDASDDHELLGLAGPAAEPAAAAWSQRDQGDAAIVQLPPADGVTRALWIAPKGTARPAVPALDTGLWLWSEVRSGVATVTQPVVEAFVPQMLNYESVGGVNFKKGCYPGQEVVARSQFRGTLKRRAYLVHADSALAAGQEVFHASDREQPTGVVVQTAPAPGGGWDAIVSMQVASADGAALTAGGPDGPALALLPLPYGLLEDL